MQQKTKTLRLYVSGMTCTGCKSRIEKKLNGLTGVKSATVSYQTGAAEITYDPARVSQEKIYAAIEALGYGVSRGKAPASVLRAAFFLAIILILFVLLDRFGILNVLVPSQLADSSMGFGMLFVLGLITSVHCIAMCGGINLSQCLPQKTAVSQANDFRSHALLPALLYNLGRVISYTVIGFLLGLVGMLIGGTGVGVSPLLQGLLKIAAGILMILMGLNMLNLFPSLRKASVHMPSFFRKKSGKTNGKRKGSLIVGLLNGLMPCGPLQSMQIVALASGNPLTGALSMLMFSLGTVPLMLGLGSLVSAFGRKFSHGVTTVGAVLVVVLGLAMLSQGGNLSGFFSFPYLLAAAAALTVVGIVSLLPYKKTAVNAACTALAVCVCAALFLVFSAWYPQRSESGAEGNAEIIDGVQIVHSTLQPGSYPDITVQTGLPVRWIIDAPQGSINGCNNRIIIHEYGMEYAFQPGENVIEFTPEEAGSFPYSCWMGMIYGNILVTE